MPRAEAHRRGIKIIGTRWIDVNKGDNQSPVYRSRLVAKEFNTGQGGGLEEGELFAATPPLEAVRLLLSEAATYGSGEQYCDKVVMVNDVARAFFEAPMRRVVAVELPPEEHGEDDAVGLLNMSLYGTRDAAANFQREVQSFMAAAGFERSSYSPIVFFHRDKQLKTLVHGDVF